MSLVLYLHVAGTKVLFTGDSGTMGLYNAIRYAVANNIDLKSLNVLHIPHHGSRHNISRGVLDQLKSDSAIISCAKKGEPHHPSNIVVNALIRRKIKPFATQGKSIHYWFGKVPARPGRVSATQLVFTNYVQVST